MAVLRWLWAYSLWLTVPVALALIYWLSVSLGTWWTFGVRYNSRVGPFGLQSTLVDRWGYMQRRLQHELHLAPDPPKDFRTVDLLVDDRAIAALDSHLPRSGFDYVDGSLHDGKQFSKVQVRYRGDFITHWSQPKKSWRVKTKRDRLWQGMRRFNLIAPKFGAQVNNDQGYRLAGELGLAIPKHEMVWLRINGGVRGLHLLVEQLDETTLRRSGRMPGDVWVGELVAKDSWQGVSPQVFEHPGLWTKSAINNHFPVEANGAIQRLCVLANSTPSPAVHAALGELLDLEAFARLSALEVLVQYYHTSFSHNWRLYYDPWRARFEPMPWDTNAWAGPEILGPEPPIGFDPNPTRLHDLLLGNAEFLAARQRVLTAWFASGAAERWFDEMAAALPKIQKLAAVDPDLRPPRFRPVEASLWWLPQYVRWIFDEVKCVMLERAPIVEWSPRLSVADGPNPQDEWSCVVQVRGRQPAVEFQFESSEPLPAPRRVTLEVERSLSATRSIDITGRMQRAADGTRLILDLPLTGQLRPAPRFIRGKLKAFRRETVPATYRIRMEGVPATTPFTRVVVGWDGLQGRQSLVAARADKLSLRPLDHLFGLSAMSSPGSVPSWSGVVELQGITHLPHGVVIEAGTELRLGPGASVIAKGPVEMRGTAEAPVRVVRASEQPWGTFAILTRAASGTRLQHAEFVGGSGYTGPDLLREYSGMLSIHDVGNVSVESCLFNEGTVVDDMVHVVYSTAEFVNCRFVRAFSDALDVDQSDATLVGCEFVSNGNDGLDLMTSRVAVSGCRFSGNRDKGISTGEASELFVERSVFRGNVVALQAKDASVVWIQDSEISASGIGLDAFLKNWRYGKAGRILATRVRFDGNRVVLVTAQDGRIDVHEPSGEDMDIADVLAVPGVTEIQALPGHANTVVPDAMRLYRASAAGSR